VTVPRRVESEFELLPPDLEVSEYAGGFDW